MVEQEVENLHKLIDNSMQKNLFDIIVSARAKRKAAKAEVKDQE
jgi:hypothetical protein